MTDNDTDVSSTTDDRDIDSASLEIIRNACAAIAEEMNANLIRTGYSPNIKERRDCSCALFDADGEMISQAENMPVHLGAMPFSVAAAIDQFPPETLEPGDGVLLNDPFRGGAHLPDLTLVTPVFVDGDVVAYAANRAHHADVGGSSAGSVAADSTEIYQEGIRIPPVKLYEGGEVNETAMDFILANVRTPDERQGDLRAQEAANQTGRQRFQDLAEKYGAEYLGTALEEIKDYSERRMRAEIDSLPDGTYRFEDVIDDDGRGNEDLPVVAAVTVDGDSIVVDFDGTAAQTEGPVNAVFAVTASATYYAVRCVTDPDIPPNHGCYRPIDINAPEGTIVDPTPPAAVVGGNLETSQRVTDVVLGALAEATPDHVLAGSQGTMNNVTFGGTDPRDDAPYAFYETQGGGFGGRAGKDGLDGVHVHMSNTMNTPVEVLETAYPLRVTRYEFREDSGGAGEYRGGLGLRRDIGVRGHRATFSLLADRRRHAPYGLAGGLDGAPGAAYLLENALDEGADADADDGEQLAGKVVRELDPGTVVSIRTPGAGGYGNPADRDPAAIRRDVELGKMSREAARAVYGDNALDGDDGSDDDATDGRSSDR
ncbi:hydantoinase B/oxoprolinase family protein [Halomicrococcus sp. NG-SE-24]|uniref:hydantoinase B/oxoprolinase family protein n=1 Tax=Halomicrococcus sp. NG-SE-24 TaxID=3436928 RepID=UPI003D989543